MAYKYRFAAPFALGVLLLGGLPALAQEAPTAPAAAALAPAPAPAPAKADESGMGNLLITPTRVVLQGRKRAETVILNNTGDKEATFRIQLQHMRMLEGGTLELIDEKNPARPEDKFADDLVRYSPRQVTLKPGESQSVKFMMRVPEGTPEGEYRSHILFQGMPDKSQGINFEGQGAGKDDISIKLTPIYGVSVPLIVRHGELTAAASIDGAKRTGRKLEFTLHRQGNRSILGDILIADGSGKVVGMVTRVSLYVPNDKRQVSLELTADSAGPLTLKYTEPADEGGKVLAQTTIP